MGKIDLRIGDCLELMKSIPDNSIDMIFTDPPYGHSNNDGKDLIGRIGLFRGIDYVEGSISEGRPIANDGAEANEIFRQCLPEWKRILKPGACCCCCCGGGGGPDPQFARWSLWIDEVLEFKQMVVWDKGKMGIGWHYRRSYETILVSQKKGKCKWYDESHKIENIIRPGDYGIRNIIPSKEQHPTQKPTELAEHFIKLHSLPGEVVFDPFMGIGSTGVAAVRNGRKFIGFELDEHWFNVATKRITDAADQTSLF